MNLINKVKKIGVIGIGYIGLPLCLEYSKYFNVVGFDLSENRINQLRKNIDKNNEFSGKIIRKANINFTTSNEELDNCDGYIITVPTPLKRDNSPDLKFLRSASILVGTKIKKDSFVIFESTVYPGCTNEYCLPLIEKFSKLKVKTDKKKGDFFLGYSPERINPGDKINKLNSIDKIVGSDNKKFTKFLKEFYQIITTGRIYSTSNLKTAEAAKIIENTQRDLNIGLMNELSYIFEKLEINTFEAIKAASTKWNFNYYEPGLVGGHCIGIDPYYLTYKSKNVGYVPKLILAGRKINNSLQKRILTKIYNHFNFKKNKLKKLKIIFFGITFKENCSDVRNSMPLKICNTLKKNFKDIFLYDPICQVDDINNIYLKNKILSKKDLFKRKYDICILAVPHKNTIKEFKKIIRNNLNKNFLIIDIKNKLNISKSKNYFSL